MIAILKRQQFHDGIGRTLAGVTIAANGRPRPAAGATSRSSIRRGRSAMAITVDDLPEVHWHAENPACCSSRGSRSPPDGLAPPR